jgi:signal transduction histidine kinase
MADSNAQDWLLTVRRRITAADRRRPWLLDGAVMAAVTALGLSDLNSGPDDGPFAETITSADLPIALVLLLVAGLALPLWWRRRAPTVTFAAVTTAMLVAWSLGVWLDAGASLLIALYSVARYGPLRAVGWATATTALGVSASTFFLLPVSHPVPGVFLMLGTTTAAVALGLAVRTRGAYLAALEDRAARLEIERDQRVRLAAAAERSRVAREMHDIIGHNLAVMVGLADGGAVLAASRGEQGAEPLRAIGDTGRQALAELRRLLGVLREEPRDAELNPQPVLADIDSLLKRVRTAGLNVTYQTAGDLNSVGRGAQLAVYRIVQEALTNTLKHAGTAATAEVSVSVEGDEVRVRVADTGPSAGAQRPDEAGHGLVGIRERAGLYDGEVTIGPGPGGGWLVDVLLHTRAARFVMADETRRRP